MLHEFTASDIILHQPAAKGECSVLYQCSVSMVDLSAMVDLLLVAKLMQLENDYYGPC